MASVTWTWLSISPGNNYLAVTQVPVDSDLIGRDHMNNEDHSASCMCKVLFRNDIKIANTLVS